MYLKEVSLFCSHCLQLLLGIAGRLVRESLGQVDGSISQLQLQKILIPHLLHLHSCTCRGPLLQWTVHTCRVYNTRLHSSLPSEGFVVPDGTGLACIATDSETMQMRHTHWQHVHITCANCVTTRICTCVHIILHEHVFTTETQERQHTHPKSVSKCFSLRWDLNPRC